jgi:thiamine-phosphate pyrophosphorylase
MQIAFTPAAERALAAAAGWIDAGYAGDNDLHVAEVLLGLLHEPECRAALLLAACRVDAQAVRRRFPGLAPAGSIDPARAGRFSPEWIDCLSTALGLLSDYPRPLELATEHLLLGIVATPSEASQWLAQCGLRADALEAEVHRLSGHHVGPLPIDEQAPIDPEDLSPTAVVPHDQVAMLRVLDAAANRAGEGLRVIEDYLRFVLDDGHLTGICKAIRHDLTAVLAVFPATLRHHARDTQADVGTQLTVSGEQARGDSASVAQASFKRVEQSLRSLEEFAKPQSVEVAEQIEQLRYRVYTLERATDLTRDALERLAETRLYVLVDGGPDLRSFERLIESLVEAGVGAIQLRDKNLADRELLARARRIAELTRNSSTLFIMNDRPDLAALAGADGVHVGQDELSVKDARRIVGPHSLIGVSTHSIEQARAAVLDGANYIGVGPTFPSATKEFAEFTGPQLLRQVAAEIRLPAFAIGGITIENLPQVLSAGFSRVAVSGAITAAADPPRAADKMLALLYKS